MLQVGHQHTYNSFFDGVKNVIKTEGFSGLWRGSTGAMLRVGVGSSVQLSSYDTCKNIVLDSGMFEDGLYAHLAASSLAGFAVTVAMNPPDVISTRYVQFQFQFNSIQFNSIFIHITI
jgi:solute carrier family 25, member 34/35